MAFELATRRQFTFKATNEQLAKLLTLNVMTNALRVNVVGFTFSSAFCCSRYLVKIVVGTDDPNNSARGGAGDPNNPDPERTNAHQNRQFAKNLQRLHIPYTTQTVIQVLDMAALAGTPGIFRLFLSALVCANIHIRAFYFGEPALVFPLVPCTCADGSSNLASEVLSSFIEVSPSRVGKALQILSAFNLSTFTEASLCINADNIGALVTKTNNKIRNRTNINKQK